jgi:LAO/AO transport system kinase
MLESLLQRFRSGDRRALARLLSLVARGEYLPEVSADVGPAPKPSRVVAVTGGGGVGKSTLAGKLIELLRGRGQTVAVLACDPQSPLSGGALLGDRFRMPSRPDDDGVFVRSLAAVAGHGAVAEHLAVMIRLLEAFGFDVILIETVGAGQGDTAVRDLADVVVLLLQPETGDDLQWEKAGVLEVADVVAVHKADLPGAANAEAQVRSMLGLGGGRAVPVVRVSAKTGEGVEPLWSAVAACPLRRGTEAVTGRDLLRLAQETLARRFAAATADQNPELKQLITQWRQGGLADDDAAATLWRVLDAAYGPGRSKSATH